MAMNLGPVEITVVDGIIHSVVELGAAAAAAPAAGSHLTADLVTPGFCLQLNGTIPLLAATHTCKWVQVKIHVIYFYT